MDFVPRFSPVPGDHFFLLDPRGAGKTLGTQHQFPDALRVDLLDPETDRQFSAIEVKNSTQVRPEDLRALRRFAEDYPQSRRWFIYRRHDRPLRDGIP